MTAATKLLLLAFVCKTIVKKSQPKCDFVESQVYGRLTVQKENKVPIICGNNLVFESKDGKKYCLEKNPSFNDDTLSCQIASQVHCIPRYLF